MLKRILLFISLIVLTIVNGCIFSEQPMPQITKTYPPLTENLTPQPDLQKDKPLRKDKYSDWLPIQNENKFRWEAIVIHHSGCDYGDRNHIDKCHKARGFDGVGYHFIINNGVFQNGFGKPDGLVEISYRWKKQLTAAHCRVIGDRSNYWNIHSIGICLIGNFENTTPTEKQWKSLVKLVKFLQQRYHIPSTRICGHRDVKPTKCPGTNFSFAEFNLRLARYKANLASAN